jgi:hypothetical protein
VLGKILGRLTPFQGDPAVLLKVITCNQAQDGEPTWSGGGLARELSGLRISRAATYFLKNSIKNSH